ncbi:phospholipid transport system substrate-binding protein [Crenobacter luteus]|uniref:ABC transporter n=1 Tax=Crenobacter luteus TaxID=1452487 RepID=A0A163CWC3_9NEIS|nr:ABC transporter substrate-binding protein [Crenobacter luteus]KZE33331.1 ABC transporter [Crenobacter luteus]TCP13574.1 phospholipid transport system substrate-binding protein [Crenobacter luteus]
MLKTLNSLILKLALLAGLSAPALAANDSPVEMVRETSRQVLDLLKKDDGKNTRQVRAQVEALVLPNFDFKRMTAYAIGQGWRQADAEQQAELTRQFQSLLVRSYSSTMNRFKNAQVDVKPNAVVSPDGRETTVKSEVSLPNSGDKKPVAIDYTFYKSPQGWKVYNVSVEGLSLITTYRNQFNDEIRKGGVDGLIKSLQDKNAALVAKGA